MTCKYILLLGIAMALVCPHTARAEGPVAAQKPFQVKSAHGTRSDPYYWLRDDTRKQPEVLAHLNAESAYFLEQSSAHAPLTEKLYLEMVNRIQQQDSTVPYKKGAYWYATRFDKGGEYPLFVRKPTPNDKEHTMLDGNVEAKGKIYFEVGGHEVSPDARWLAYLEDNQGGRQYTLRFRDLKTGKNLPDTIGGLSETLAWANDSKTFYYVENDPVTLLSTRVKRHTLGTDPAKDEVIYEETDNTYFISVKKTGDDRFVMIFARSTETNETLVLDANVRNATPHSLAPRSRSVKYNANHIGQRWIIRTDWNAPNYRLMTVADGALGDRAHWRELVPHNEEVFIADFNLFKNYLVVNERSNGLLRLRVIPWGTTEKARLIQSDEPAFVTRISAHAQQDSNVLLYNYTSLTTPPSEYAMDMNTGARTLLKQQVVLGGFDRERYTTERTWATARDGARIPVSLAYRKGTPRDGTAPIYQVAYGAYGVSSDPAFRSNVLSLLDRGVVYAIAHVRGGEEMGRAWYDSGRLLTKQNTFTDFIDVTDHLVAQKHGASDKVFGMGRSAGGLLMGAVANLAGEKYAGLIAHVPFVDVVTTMLDESIPLTTNEFDEWGNPKEKTYYDYMLSYSPYDNVRAKAYPAMLVTAGLYDSQVQYYEPAKWVAKLRANKTDTHPLLFKVNMEAGHGGQSGRFLRHRETAEEYAFILHRLGISQ